MSVKFFISVGLICFAKAQVIRRGRCPTVYVKEDFDLDQYLGKWYENQRSFAIFEMGLECVTAEYAKGGDGEITILNKGVRRDGSVSSIYGTGRLANTSSSEGKLVVKFEDVPFDADYWILDTDYTTYSIVFSCSNILIVHTENLWILSRQPTLSEETLNNIYQFLDSNGVARNGLVRIRQNCNQTVVD